MPTRSYLGVFSELKMCFRCNAIERDSKRRRKGIDKKSKTGVCEIEIWGCDGALKLRNESPRGFV